MRKHDLCQMISTLTPSAKDLVWAWITEMALQVRHPLFFGNLPEISYLESPNHVSGQVEIWAIRTELRKGKHLFSVHYNPLTMALGPRMSWGVNTFSAHLDHLDFIDLLTEAMLREGRS